MRTLGSFGIATVENRGPWEKIDPASRTALALEPNQRKKAHDKTVDINYRRNDPVMVKINLKLGKVKNKLSSIKPDTTLVMVEMEETPRETYIMKRGVYKDKGRRKVSPGVPAICQNFQ